MQLTTLFATVLSVASLVSAAALPPAVVEEDKALDKRRLHVFRDGHVRWVFPFSAQYVVSGMEQTNPSRSLCR